MPVYDIKLPPEFDFPLKGENDICVSEKGKKIIIDPYCTCSVAAVEKED